MLAGTSITLCTAMMWREAAVSSLSPDPVGNSAAGVAYCDATGAGHAQVRHWLWMSGILPVGMVRSADDLRGLSMELAATVAATYTVASASYFLVEKPCARWWMRHALAGCGAPDVQ